MSIAFEPASETEAAGIILEAAAQATPLAIIGGGTRSGFGNRGGG